MHPSEIVGAASDARAEANRDGTPQIDLLDGDMLCDLLKENGIGVTTTARVVIDDTARQGQPATRGQESITVSHEDLLVIGVSVVTTPIPKAPT